MLLDSNILIYAANQPAPEVEDLVTSAENTVASVTEIEVYGFTGLKPHEKAALDLLFRRLTVICWIWRLFCGRLNCVRPAKWDWQTLSSPARRSSTSALGHTECRRFQTCDRANVEN